MFTEIHFYMGTTQTWNSPSGFLFFHGFLHITTKERDYQMIFLATTGFIWKQTFLIVAGLYWMNKATWEMMSKLAITQKENTEKEETKSHKKWHIW